VVIDAVTDPEVPPLPPHIRYEHAKALFKSLMKGDPEALRVVKESFEEKLPELVHR
jgi:pyruvate dehydrogenase (quinone)